MLLTIIWLLITLPTLRQYQAMLYLRNYYHQCPFFTLCHCSGGQNSTDRHLAMMYCKSVPIYKFPDIPYEKIDRLVIHGSKLTNLEFESLSSFRMQTLVLSHNRIQTIYSKSFSASENSLQYLDLSHNNLHSVPLNAITNLKSIHYLNLQNNEIDTIFGNWQHLHSTLRSLFLSNNDIDLLTQPDYHHQDLRELNSLLWLNLDHNQISNISTKSLPSNLQTLSLSKNHINHFPYGLLRHPLSLKWLYLKGNYIDEIRHEFRSQTQVWIEKIDIAENCLLHFPKLSSSQPHDNVIIRDLNLSFNCISKINNDDLSHIKNDRLILSFNQISHIGEKAFRNVAKTLTYLDLDHNFIRDIPKALQSLQHLKYLYLSSNRISSLNNFHHNFTNTIKALSLSNNQLKSIPTFPNLTYLNMGYNEIYHVPNLSCLNLKTLLLHNNRLTELKRVQFNSCLKLEELNLSFNPIRTIDGQVFENLTYLRSLEMAFNDLDETNSEFLKPLNNVQWLLFDNNSFKKAPKYFNELANVQYVNFEWNKLRDFPVLNLDRLEDLRLSFNYFERVSRDQFVNLKKLRSIFLNGNQITVVETGSFSKLPMIELIMICDNKLGQIDQFSFTHLPKLKVLSLQRNRLKHINLSMFHNISTTRNEFGMTLNLSRNHLNTCHSPNNPSDLTVKIAKIDFNYNQFPNWPHCLSYLSHSLLQVSLQNNIIEVLEWHKGDNQSEASNRKFNELQAINFNKNRIKVIQHDFFKNFPKLQIVDLSENQLQHINLQQFATNAQLRFLNLSSNSLSYLAKDVFQFCKLEMLDLSSNRFNAIPQSAINLVSLRFLSLGSNAIDYLDSTMLWKLLNLETLNMYDNRITVLADNVFSNMAKLRHLSLKGNLIRANFKELFHYAHDLFELNFSHNDFVTVPVLPLPNLIKLNVAYNSIESVFLNSTDNLIRLKYLFLNNNRLRTVPSHIWQSLPKLKFLDLSGNFFKDLNTNSFMNLNKLTHLRLIELDNVRNIDADLFRPLKSTVEKLSIGIYPHLRNNHKKLCSIFLKSLDHLKDLEIVEQHPENRRMTVTKDMFSCLDDRRNGRKLERVVLKGSSIAKIEDEAFEKLANSIRLEIEISQTEIDELPVGLFSHFNRIGRLKIVLRRNLWLSVLSPETFYSNASSWEKIGTRLLADGLIIQDQNWQCGCNVAWLGHWYRRWIHESLQLYNQSPETVLESYETINQITCLNSDKNSITDDDNTENEQLPIVNLLPEEMQCQASALNYAVDVFSTFYHFVAIFLFFL